MACGRSILQVRKRRRNLTGMQPLPKRYSSTSVTPESALTDVPLSRPSSARRHVVEEDDESTTAPSKVEHEPDLPPFEGFFGGCGVDGNGRAGGGGGAGYSIEEDALIDELESSARPGRCGGGSGPQLASSVGCSGVAQSERDEGLGGFGTSSAGALLPHNALAAALGVEEAAEGRAADGDGTGVELPSYRASRRTARRLAGSGAEAASPSGGGGSAAEAVSSGAGGGSSAILECSPTFQASSNGAQLRGAAATERLEYRAAAPGTELTAEQLGRRQRELLLSMMDEEPSTAPSTALTTIFAGGGTMFEDDAQDVAGGGCDDGGVHDGGCGGDGGGGSGGGADGKSESHGCGAHSKLSRRQAAMSEHERLELLSMAPRTANACATSAAAGAPQQFARVASFSQQPDSLEQFAHAAVFSQQAEADRLEPPVALRRASLAQLSYGADAGAPSQRAPQLEDRAVDGGRSWKVGPAGWQIVSDHAANDDEVAAATAFGTLGGIGMQQAGRPPTPELLAKPSNPLWEFPPILGVGNARNSTSFALTDSHSTRSSRPDSARKRRGSLAFFEAAATLTPSALTPRNEAEHGLEDLLPPFDDSEDDEAMATSADPLAPPRGRQAKAALRAKADAAVPVASAAGKASSTAAGKAAGKGRRACAHRQHERPGGKEIGKEPTPKRSAPTLPREAELPLARPTTVPRLSAGAAAFASGSALAVGADGAEGGAGTSACNAAAKQPRPAEQGAVASVTPAANCASGPGGLAGLVRSPSKLLKKAERQGRSRREEDGAQRTTRNAPSLHAADAPPAAAGSAAGDSDSSTAPSASIINRLRSSGSLHREAMASIVSGWFDSGAAHGDGQGGGPAGLGGDGQGRSSLSRPGSGRSRTDQERASGDRDAETASVPSRPGSARTSRRLSHATAGGKSVWNDDFASPVAVGPPATAPSDHGLGQPWAPSGAPPAAGPPARRTWAERLTGGRAGDPIGRARISVGGRGEGGEHAAEGPLSRPTSARSAVGDFERPGVTEPIPPSPTELAPSHLTLSPRCGRRASCTEDDAAPSAAWSLGTPAEPLERRPQPRQMPPSEAAFEVSDL